MWDRVINTISRMWVIIFWLKPECAIEKIKIKVKLYRKGQKYKTYYTETAFEWKRIKAGKNYA